MSEHPNAILTALVASAATLAIMIGGSLAALGISGVGALAATIIGALTACVFFLAELDRIPLSALVLVTIALTSTASLVRTLWLYRRERRLLAALPLAALEDGPLNRLATGAGLRVYVTPARRPAAFCFGLFRPRVVVTSGLLDRLSLDEQEAVLWHEAEHARRYEPLKCLLARLASTTFFWLPVLHDLLERFLLVKEIVADRRAASRTSTSALAGALYEVASAPSLAAIGAGDLASVRIEQLLVPRASLPPLFRLRHLAVSALGWASLALAIIFPSPLDVGERAHLRAMLTSTSMHGIPGMTAGLIANVFVLAGFCFAWRRVRSTADRPAS